MQPRLARQLRVKRDGQHVSLSDRDGMVVDAPEHLDAGAMLCNPRRADEHGVDWPAIHARYVEVGFERVQLASERVTAGADVEHV